MKGINRVKKTNSAKCKNGKAYAQRQRKPEGWDKLSPLHKFMIGVLR